MGVQKLTELRDTMNEVIRMHELNSELLNTLLLMGYKIRDCANVHNAPLLNDGFYSLLRKAETLLKEVSSDLPNIHESVIRRNFTERKPDDNLTESK